MNTAVICLGANAPDAEKRLAEAFDKIGSLGVVCRNSGTYRTDPEYAGPTEPYLNEVIEFATPCDYDGLHSRLKAYEGSVRAKLPQEWSGLVNLDIDIVLWNGTVIRPADAAASYFKEGLSRLNVLE